MIAARLTERSFDARENGGCNKAETALHTRLRQHSDASTSGLWLQSWDEQNGSPMKILAPLSDRTTEAR